MSKKEQRYVNRHDGDSMGGFIYKNFKDYDYKHLNQLFTKKSKQESVF